jgi:hypothetical protein
VCGKIGNVNLVYKVRVSRDQRPDASKPNGIELLVPLTVAAERAAKT